MTSSKEQLVPVEQLRQQIARIILPDSNWENEDSKEPWHFSPDRHSALKKADRIIAILNTRKPDEGLVTNGEYDADDLSPIGDAARRIASYCEGEQRVNVFRTAKHELTALRTPPAVEPDEGLVTGDEAIQIVITKTGTFLVSWPQELNDWIEGIYWEDNIDMHPPELENGAYVWTGYKQGFSDEDEPLNLTGGTFTRLAHSPAPSIRAQAFEEAAKVADEHRRLRLQAKDNAIARKAKSEARDHESMAIEASHIASAIRARKGGQGV